MRFLFGISDPDLSLIDFKVISKKYAVLNGPPITTTLLPEEMIILSLSGSLE